MSAAFWLSKAKEGYLFLLDAAVCVIIIFSIDQESFSCPVRRHVMRGLVLPAAIIAAFALSGCNETAQPVAVAAPQPMAPSGPAIAGMPPGAPCTNAIGAYQTVIQHDADTGNVNQSVYHQIEDEISRAAAACSSGHDGEARSLLQASKERHGYHM